MYLFKTIHQSDRMIGIIVRWHSYNWFNQPYRVWFN